VADLGVGITGERAGAGRARGLGRGGPGWSVGLSVGLSAGQGSYLGSATPIAELPNRTASPTVASSAWFAAATAAGAAGVVERDATISARLVAGEGCTAGRLAGNEVVACREGDSGQ
jgi:hypothetical protein